MVPDNPPVVFLMGPTASGKTSLAIDLVQNGPFEIVSVDSAMVYRGLDIGTAKPTPEQQQIAPHHLIDICDPAEAYSAARFRTDALQVIADIQARGQVPLLVGGTGLYFRALEQGLSALPAADPDLRRELEAEARRVGWQAMHARLQAVDPESAGRIHPNDPQRIQRALEVFELSGVPLSQHLVGEAEAPPRVDCIKIILCPSDRAVLRQAAADRFEQMLALGFEQEVRHLRQRGDLHAGLPSMRLVGYRQMWQYLAGTLDHADMKAHAVVATRQLAKRQLTWFRRETNGHWFASEDGHLHRKIRHFLFENRHFAAIL